jgi:Ca2+-binding EF-hand superfamily protein
MLDVPHGQRIKMAFEFYKDAKTDTISKDGLTRVLRANYATKSPQAVAKKVSAIMRQADKNNDGHLTKTDFFAVSRKLPSLVFPTFSDV